MFYPKYKLHFLCGSFSIVICIMCDWISLNSYSGCERVNQFKLYEHRYIRLYIYLVHPYWDPTLNKVKRNSFFLFVDPFLCVFKTKNQTSDICDFYKTMHMLQQYLNRYFLLVTLFREKK